MSDLNRRIELEALITEREGMIAENATRRDNGQAPAYHFDSFISLADRIRALAESEAPPAYTPEDVARLVEAAREVWASLPGTYDESDPMVKRHARALVDLPSALAPFKEKA